MGFSRLEPLPCFGKISPARSAAEEISAEHQLRPWVAALRRLAKPALRQTRICCDIMTAMVKRTEREHRPNVALTSSPFE